MWREEWYAANGIGGYVKREGDPFAVIDARTSTFKENAYYFKNVVNLQIYASILDLEHLDPVIDKICTIVVKCAKIRRLVLKIDQMRGTFLLQIRRQIQDIVEYAMKNKRKGYKVEVEFVGTTAQG